MQFPSRRVIFRRVPTVSLRTFDVWKSKIIGFNAFCVSSVDVVDFTHALISGGRVNTGCGKREGRRAGGKTGCIWWWWCDDEWYSNAKCPVCVVCVVIWLCCTCCWCWSCNWSPDMPLIDEGCTDEIGEPSAATSWWWADTLSGNLVCVCSSMVVTCVAAIDGCECIYCTIERLAGDECCDNVSDDKTPPLLECVGDAGCFIGGGWISINVLRFRANSNEKRKIKQRKFWLDFFAFVKRTAICLVATTKHKCSL